MRNETFIETKVYQKPINNRICSNWKSFARNTWKCKTLRALLKWAYLICLFKKHLVG